jgi:hydrogenase maturation protease
LGNDLLSDDSIGLRIVDAARECLADCKNVTVLKSAEMGLALLDLVVGFDGLILVDAIQTGHAPPGFVHLLDPGNLKVLPTRSPHFVGVGEVLSLGRKLGHAMPGRVQIFAIEVEDPFTVSSQMSHDLEALLPFLVGQITEATRRIASTGFPD